MAISMILAFYRQLITNHNDIKKNKWKKYSGETLLNKKIGVIGVGNIGKKIIEMIQGFETINYVNDINKINKNFLLKYKLKSKTKKFIYNSFTFKLKLKFSQLKMILLSSIEKVMFSKNMSD